MLCAYPVGGNRIRAFYLLFCCKLSWMTAEDPTTLKHCSRCWLVMRNSDLPWRGGMNSPAAVGTAPTTTTTTTTTTTSHNATPAAATFFFSFFYWHQAGACSSTGTSTGTSSRTVSSTIFFSYL